MFTLQTKNTDNTWTHYAMYGDLMIALDAWRVANSKRLTVRIINAKGDVVHG